MPGLTAKYLRSAPKGKAGAGTRCAGEEDARSVSSQGSMEEVTGGLASSLSVSDSRGGLRRPAWREAWKYLDSHSK